MSSKLNAWVRIPLADKPRPLEYEEWWSMDKVEAFYRECCEGREEEPFPGISAAMKVRRSFNISSWNSLSLLLMASHTLTLSAISCMLYFIYL